MKELNQYNKLENVAGGRSWSNDWWRSIVNGLKRSLQSTRDKYDRDR